MTQENRPDKLKLKKTISSRISYIDVARGIFLFWMIAVHAMVIANLPDNSPLKLIRPSGWATTCFIMLSGLSIAMVFLSKKRDYSAVKRRLLNRAREIAVVAYVSNLAFVSLKLMISGTFTFDLFIRIATFQYPWSISSILLPVTITLLVSPLLIRLATRISSWSLFGLMILLNLSTSAVDMYTPDSVRDTVWFEICYESGNIYGIFPLVRFVLLSFWSFSLGVLLKKGSLTLKSWWVIMPVCCAAYWFYSSFFEFRAFIPYFVLEANKLLISLGIAFIMCNVQFVASIKFKGLLGLLGRSSLFVFILHRPFIHAQSILLSKIKLDPEAASVIFIVITMALSLAMCLTKESYPKLARQLKRVGF